MNKSRIPMLIVSVSLVAVIGVVFLTFQRTIPVEGSSQAVQAGMGDLRLYESEQSLPGTGRADSQEAIHPAVIGIGDLRLYEATQAALSAGQKPQAVPGDGNSFAK